MVAPWANPGKAYIAMVRERLRSTSTTAGRVAMRRGNHERANEHSATVEEHLKDGSKGRRLVEAGFLLAFGLLWRAGVGNDLVNLRFREP